jgi:hypothetical protein
MNSLIIQWNHLAYMGTFCYSEMSPMFLISFIMIVTICWHLQMVWKHSQKNQGCQGKSLFPRTTHDICHFCVVYNLNNYISNTLLTLHFRYKYILTKNWFCIIYIMHSLMHPQAPWWTQLWVQRWWQWKEKELGHIP